jgi:hypothetical protein
MPTRTPSQRSAMSRAKGAKFERRLAVALKPWFPDARRSRDNGFRSSISSSPDLGDVDLGTAEFFVSAKDNHEGDTDSACTVGAWFLECQTKASNLGRSGVLIQKRPGYADPLDSWCWVSLTDLVATTGVALRYPAYTHPDIPVRLSLRDWLGVLERNGLSVAYPTLEPKIGPESDPDGLDPVAGGVRPAGAAGQPRGGLA